MFFFCVVILHVVNTGRVTSRVSNFRVVQDICTNTTRIAGKIKRRADKFLGLKARDRPDAVAQFFEMNVKEMVKFLKERKPLGDIVAGVSIGSKPTRPEEN
nr:hypothetical protein [Tanacetum cinerariifolium]